jgi:ketosteroid isomerase-like protein
MRVAARADSGSAATAVKAVADEEFRAMAAGDVAAFLRILAPDAVFFPPNEPPKSGSAVEPWISEFLAGYAVEFQEHGHDEVLLADGWALLRTGFRWTVAPRAGGQGFVRLGNTVRLFRQNEAGTWQLAREIWTTYPVR